MGNIRGMEYVWRLLITELNPSIEGKDITQFMYDSEVL